MCLEGDTSHHTPNSKIHGIADERHEHPQDQQEVPVLTHTEQLLLQPLQATWTGTSGTEKMWLVQRGTKGTRLGALRPLPSLYYTFIPLQEHRLHP